MRLALPSLCLFAITARGASGQDARKSALEERRLDTLIELAEAGRDCSRIEAALAKLDLGTFDAASDKTLERLTLQLNASEKALRDLRSAAGQPEDAKNKIDATAARVAALSAKVRLARTSVREYFQQELAESRSEKNRLKAKLEEMQTDTAEFRDLSAVAEQPVDCKSLAYPGLLSGTLRWNGELPANGTLVLGRGLETLAGPAGRWTGDHLPGCDISLSQESPGIDIEAPAGGNNFSRLRVRNVSGSAVHSVFFRWQIR
jgi:hypothetical protein